MIYGFSIICENHVQKCAHFLKNVHIFIEIMIILNTNFKPAKSYQDIARTTFPNSYSNTERCTFILWCPSSHVKLALTKRINIFENVHIFGVFPEAENVHIF